MMHSPINISVRAEKRRREKKRKYKEKTRKEETMRWMEDREDREERGKRERVPRMKNQCSLEYYLLYCFSSLSISCDKLE